MRVLRFAVDVRGGNERREADSCAARGTSADWVRWEPRMRRTPVRRGLEAGHGARRDRSAVPRWLLVPCWRPQRNVFGASAKTVKTNNAVYWPRPSFAERSASATRTRFPLRRGTCRAAPRMRVAWRTQERHDSRNGVRRPRVSCRLWCQPRGVGAVHPDRVMTVMRPAPSVCGGAKLCRTSVRR
jgi:hypothetical protein